MFSGGLACFPGQGPGLVGPFLNVLAMTDTYGLTLGCHDRTKAVLEVQCVFPERGGNTESKSGKKTDLVKRRSHKESREMQQRLFQNVNEEDRRAGLGLTCWSTRSSIISQLSGLQRVFRTIEGVSVCCVII